MHNSCASLKDIYDFLYAAISTAPAASLGKEKKRPKIVCCCHAAEAINPYGKEVCNTRDP